MLFKVNYIDKSASSCYVEADVEAQADQLLMQYGLPFGGYTSPISFTPTGFFPIVDAEAIRKIRADNVVLTSKGWPRGLERQYSYLSAQPLPTAQEQNDLTLLRNNAHPLQDKLRSYEEVIFAAIHELSHKTTCATHAGSFNCDCNAVNPARARALLNTLLPEQPANVEKSAGSGVNDQSSLSVG